MLYLPLLQNDFLFNFALPFALIFAVLYSILTSSGVISDKNSCVIIALVLSLFAIIYPPTSSVVVSSAPFIAVVFFLIFLIKIILKQIAGIGNGNVDDAKEKAFLLFFLLIALGFLSNTNFAMYLNLDPDTVKNIIWGSGFVIVMLIIYIALKYGRQNQ